MFRGVTSDLKSEQILGTFQKNELHKANQKEFRVEKVIWRKDDKLYHCIKYARIRVFTDPYSPV